MGTTPVPAQPGSTPATATASGKGVGPPASFPTPVPTDKPLCELSGVCQEYVQPSGQRLRVLDNIDLQVREHEVLALLGPSGCGKSTILRILGGLFSPSSGTVSNKGEKLNGLNPHVGMVFQSFALYPWMTARENILAVLAAAGLDHAAACARADQVIQLVGLGGFADAYPRQLSGGMKQRIGIARAIACDRELLFMDEPFSQVDALTAESLRSEVLDLWAPLGKNPSSIVMVSHDIKEVVYMADRIVVLGANPGKIRTIVTNKLPRPRDYRAPEFLQLVDRIHDIITGHEMPDAPAPAAGAAPQIEPLPLARPGGIVGLVEYLQARRGQEDIFRIAADTGREFGEMITVVRAAEVLDLVDTPKRMVVLTPVGANFAKAVADDRLRIWREQLLGIRLFKELYDLIQRQPEKRLSGEIALETIVLHMPQEDHEKQFETMVIWARFGELFVYDEAADILAIEG
jgi:NitT/TauT family transport system ATP-binding protein